MSPLLFTSAFLLLMALFVSSEVAQFSTSHLEKKLYKSQLLAYSESQKEKLRAIFDDFEGEESESEFRLIPAKVTIKKEATEKTYARSLGFQKTRPPNNSRLNFYHLLHEPHQSYYPKDFSIYETTARLLRALYGSNLFLQERVDIEYHLLNALLAQKEKTVHFTYPDDLASLEIEDPALQKLFYHILRGGFLHQPYPSLLEYITFDPQGTSYTRKINFLFASDILIHILIKEKEVASYLLEKRALLMDAIVHQEKNRKGILQKDAMGRRDIQEKAQEVLKNVLQIYGIDPAQYVPLFDYSLGKKGNILYVEDPLTCSYKREKLPPRKIS